MHKNRLQEFCQKNQHPLPTYETIKVGGPSHEPSFVSTVSIRYNNNTYQAISNEFNSKKAAELDAAEIMLYRLTSIMNEHTDQYVSNTVINIFVDMENISMKDFFTNKKFDNNFRFIGFATHDHPSIKLHAPLLNDIITINSDRKDACDILMIGYISRNIDNMEGDIIILTKDHFGPGLVDYLTMISKSQNSNNDNDNRNIVCLKSTESLNEYLTNIKN